MAALPVYRKYLKYMRKITCVFIAISFAVCACSAVDGPKSGSKPKAKPELNNMVHYVVNNGKSGKSGALYYHLLFTLNTGNLTKFEVLSERQFKQNGGQFEVLLKEQSFPIAAPDCKSNIILRIPWVAGQLGLAQKYLLYKTIMALTDNQKGTVTVAIELNPYVKTDGRVDGKVNGGADGKADRKADRKADKIKTLHLISPNSI
jgi:hypothetical protein